MVKFWWIPVAIIWYMASAWASKKAHDDGGIWVFWLVVSTCCPLWVFVSLKSTNLIYDALLYDVIICGSFLAGLFVVGSARSFNWLEYLGVLLISFGFIILKYGEYLVSKNGG